MRRAAVVVVVVVAACGRDGSSGLKSGSGSGSGSGVTVQATPFTDKQLERFDVDVQDLERSVTVMPHADFVRKAIESLGTHGGLAKGCGKLVSAYSGAGDAQQEKFAPDVVSHCNFACKTEDGCGAPDPFGGAKLRAPDRVVLAGALELSMRALAEQGGTQADEVKARLAHTMEQLGGPDVEADSEPPAPEAPPKPNTARLSGVKVPADKGRMRAAIYTKYRADVEACGVKAKASGKWVMHVALDGDGKVVHAHFDDAKDAVGVCVAAAAEKWQFVKGSPAIADVTFELTYTK